MLYMFIAEGFEEVEAIAAADVLRRAGVETVLVGVGSKNVTGSHNFTVECDITDSEISLDDSLQGVILPGGMPGTLNLENSKTVIDTVSFCAENGKLVAAICAAPSILGHMGLLAGKSATCFPGFEKDLHGAVISNKFVCAHGNYITAKGMGSAVKFGLKIAEYFIGTQKAANLEATLQCS